jgi:hypothetical protein
MGLVLMGLVLMGLMGLMGLVLMGLRRWQRLVNGRILGSMRHVRGLRGAIGGQARGGLLVVQREKSVPTRRHLCILRAVIDERNALPRPREIGCAHQGRLFFVLVSIAAAAGRIAAACRNAVVAHRTPVPPATELPVAGRHEIDDVIAKAQNASVGRDDEGGAVDALGNCGATVHAHEQVLHARIRFANGTDHVAAVLAVATVKEDVSRHIRR